MLIVPSGAREAPTGSLRYLTGLNAAWSVTFGPGVASVPQAPIIELGKPHSLPNESVLRRLR